MTDPFSRPWMYDDSAAAVLHGKGTGLKGIIAGGITGGIEICITYPTEYVKTQLQLDGKPGTSEQKFKGIADCVKKTVKERGVRGLYRGVLVLLSGCIPKAGARFGTFESLKNHLVDENGRLKPHNSALCGLGAGTVEALLFDVPLETIKVKFINDQRSSKPRYEGFVHGVRTIIKEEGIKGIFQGVTASTLKQGTNQMIRFFIMESSKNIYCGGDPSVHVPKWLTAIFGFTAGGISVICNNPLDVVKTRMQGLEASKYKNTIDCTIQTLKNEGPIAFYKGTVPRLGKVCLECAIVFTLYDIVHDLVKAMWP